LAGTSTACAALQKEMMPTRPATTATLHVKVFLRLFMGSPFVENSQKKWPASKLLRARRRAHWHKEKRPLPNEGTFHAEAFRSPKNETSSAERTALLPRKGLFVTLCCIIISLGNLFFFSCQPDMSFSIITRDSRFPDDAERLGQKRYRLTYFSSTRLREKSPKKLCRILLKYLEPEHARRIPSRNSLPSFAVHVSVFEKKGMKEAKICHT